MPDNDHDRINETVARHEESIDGLWHEVRRLGDHLDKGFAELRSLIVDQANNARRSSETRPGRIIAISGIFFGLIAAVVAWGVHQQADTEVLKERNRWIERVIDLRVTAIERENALVIDPIKDRLDNLESQSTPSNP